MNRFEADARVAGVDEVQHRGRELCGAWGDEQITAAPWGAGRADVRHFHGEANGGDKLLRLLARLSESGASTARCSNSSTPA